jgi:hypothetical protein
VHLTKGAGLLTQAAGVDSQDGGVNRGTEQRCAGNIQKPNKIFERGKDPKRSRRRYRFSLQ